MDKPTNIKWKHGLTTKERILGRVQHVGECWEWQGVLMPTGYGRITVDGHSRLVHRIAYTVLVGPIPEGLQLDHLCRNRGCVNPAHLEPVTLAENVLRGEAASAKAKRRDHCEKGHPYTAENTYIYGRKRVCLECRAERLWEHRQRLGQTAPLNQDKTHCPQGHAYDEINTRWKNGTRKCRACDRDRARANRLKGLANV